VLGRRYRGEMHIGLTVPALVFGLLAGSVGAAQADDNGSKGGIIPLMRSLVQGDNGSEPPARNAGILEGRVVAVDRAHGVMTVQSGRGRYDVMVLPSTNIQGHDGDFHTIADLYRGQLVRIFMSQRDGVYFAQFIHLHTER
jgi:hypothetical protein